MATNSIDAVLAPVKGEDLTARKARLDAAFHSGTKATRQALMAHNGLRAAREAKGYGRAAMAKALGITPAAWWVAEFVLVPGTPEHKRMAALVKALPALGKGGSTTAPATKPVSLARTPKQAKAKSAATAARQAAKAAAASTTPGVGTDDLIG